MVTKKDEPSHVARPVELSEEDLKEVDAGVMVRSSPSKVEKHSKTSTSSDVDDIPFWLSGDDRW